jgi:hypothetical protein
LDRKHYHREHSAFYAPYFCLLATAATAFSKDGDANLRCDAKLGKKKKPENRPAKEPVEPKGTTLEAKEKARRENVALAMAAIDELSTPMFGRKLAPTVDQQARLLYLALKDIDSVFSKDVDVAGKLFQNLDKHDAGDVAVDFSVLRSISKPLAKKLNEHLNMLLADVFMIYDHDALAHVYGSTSLLPEGATVEEFALGGSGDSRLALVLANPETIENVYLSKCNDSINRHIHQKSYTLKHSKATFSGCNDLRLFYQKKKDPHGGTGSLSGVAHQVREHRGYTNADLLGYFRYEKSPGEAEKKAYYNPLRYGSFIDHGFDYAFGGKKFAEGPEKQFLMKNDNFAGLVFEVSQAKGNSRSAQQIELTFYSPRVDPLNTQIVDCDGEATNEHHLTAKSVAASFINNFPNNVTVSDTALASIAHAIRLGFSPTYVLDDMGTLGSSVTFTRCNRAGALQSFAIGDNSSHTDTTCYNRSVHARSTVISQESLPDANAVLESLIGSQVNSFKQRSSVGVQFALGHKNKR